MVVKLPKRTAQIEQPVPKGDGLRVAVSVRSVLAEYLDDGLPPGTRSVSVFLVNRRTPLPDEIHDQAFTFQAQLEIRGDRQFVPRSNLRSLESDDWDERVADLQYFDAIEFGVGHSISTECILNEDGQCWTVRTCWIPQAEVERVAPVPMEGVELSMDALSSLTDSDEAQAKLGGFVEQYRQ